MAPFNFVATFSLVRIAAHAFFCWSFVACAKRIFIFTTYHGTIVNEAFFATQFVDNRFLRHFAHYGRRIMRHRFPIKCENVHVSANVFTLSTQFPTNKPAQMVHIHGECHMIAFHYIQTSRQFYINIRKPHTLTPLIGANEIYVVQTTTACSSTRNITGCLLLRKQFEANNLWKRFPISREPSRSLTKSMCVLC